MSGISMPPISSLQRYLTDAHDSLRAKEDDHRTQDKPVPAHNKANENTHNQNDDSNIINLRK
jgi:hypothetical protein